jgi:galactonate dehydratase
METFIVEAGVACWVFLKLHTDEGVTGLGDCTLESKEYTVLGALKDVAPLVIGKDPTAIERLWQELYRLSPWQGVGLFTAMSGIEQAMWDITGKAYGQPVYRLLGGACRDRLRLYTWPQPTSDTPEGYAEGALEADAQGYGALKTDPFGDSFFTVTPSQIERAISRVAAMRDAVGPEVAIAVDGHQRFYPQAAIAIARELEPLGVLFFEEPVPSDNLDALAKVSEGLRHLRVPLATGERHFTRWAFRPLLERQLVDVVQPDVCHVGGLWELRKIAAMAEPYGVPIAPHNPNGPVGLAAAAHVGFCTPNFLALESTHTRAWQWDLVTPALTIEQGHVLRPDRPGLGFELDEDAVRRRTGTPRPMDFWRRIVVE